MGCDIEMIGPCLGVDNTLFKVGVLRGGINFLGYGDDFTYAATTIIYQDTLFLKGMIGEFNFSIRQDIRDLLTRLDLVYIRWDRYNANQNNNLKPACIKHLKFKRV